MIDPKIELIYTIIFSFIMFLIIMWFAFYAPCWIYTIGSVPARCISYFLKWTPNITFQIAAQVATQTMTKDI